MSKCITQQCSFHDINADSGCSRFYTVDWLGGAYISNCPNYTTMKGEDMKRYKLMAAAIAPKKLTGAVVDHWEYKHIEDPDGKWVKWEDVQKEMDELYKTAYIEGYDNAKLAEGFTKSMVAGNVECNCEEKYPDNFHWFCPAHGYKRR